MKHEGWQEGELLIMKIVDAHYRNVRKCKW